MDKEVAKLKSILEAMEDGIYVTSRDYTVEFMNAPMISDFGDGVGKKCYEVINQQDEICPWCEAEEVFKGQRRQREVFVPSVNKTYSLIEIPFEDSEGNFSKLSVYRDISKRKQRERELQETQEDFRSLFEHVSCGVYVSSKEGKFHNANHTLLDMLGYDSKGEFLNIDIARDLYLRPEDRSKFQEMIERDGKVIEYEVEFKRKDGRKIPILLTAHVRLDQEGEVLGYEGIMVDQSQRKQMEEDYKRLFEHVSCGVYVSSKEGKFHNANEALLEMLGYDNKEEFLNIDIARDLYLKPEDRSKFQELVERDGKVIDYEVDIKRKDGRVIPVLLTSHVRLDRDDRVLGYEGIIVDQSQRKQMEEDYKRLFEHVGCGVYVSSKEGKFLNANEALLNMLGYDNKEEFLNINIARDLYVRREDRSKFQEMIERDGKVIDFEVEFKRKNGTPVSVLHTGHARYDEDGNVVGYEGLNVDQSQRKQMEAEIKEAHDFMNKIIQSSPDAIMATNMKGEIIIWNRAAEETLGYGSEEVLGKMNIDKIYPEGMAKKVMMMMRSPEYGNPGKLRSYPMVYVRRDGEVVEGNLSSSLIFDAEGKEIASVGIFVDLKERLEMERKLHQTQEQLLQSEKLAAMGRLTSQIAHELNNPLYGIMNTLELLKTEIAPDSKRRKILEMALSETERLTDMLRKMLSFSKPDQEEKQPTDLNTILDEILLLHEKQLSERSIKIASNFDQELGPVKASRNQLRQVVLNMVSNARDAMPDGGTLSVSTKSVGNIANIEISDTGVGIEKEHLDKVFDTFFTTKDSVKGVGLGLSVCYGFIQDHGGDIKVESEPDSGTTFTITLPLIQSP